MSHVDSLEPGSGDLIDAARGTANRLAEALAGDQPPPDSLPGYAIVRELHRGGQGVVYQAVQRSTNRDVAIKVMRDGPFIGRRGRARFEREVRLLAQLKHPNIVTIHDSGVSSGCHFFAMDYIEGEPLDTYVNGSGLSVGQKLDLFVKVCVAVHAAHLRGVIHRDLKPGNIRVDEKGEPHILDFGLAKSSGEDSDDGEGRAMTVTGQFVGSMPWASPEQVQGPPTPIDLRTDIYSLGVILYHMLTGRFPYPVAGSVRDVMSNVLDADPVRPRSIIGEIDEDVDTILLKCLAKQPNERYQSVSAVADDIERYLRHEPILARAPSTAYQVKKLVQRHRLPVAVVLLFVAMVLAFGIGMAVLYGRAADQRDRAVLAEQSARGAQEEAKNRRVEAELEAETAEAIRRFLVEDLLSAAKPENTLGRKVTVEEVLGEASARVEEAFREHAEIEASVRDTLGQVYQSLGLNDAAAEHLRASISLYNQSESPDALQLLRVKAHLIRVLRAAFRWAEAISLCEAVLQEARQRLGSEDELTLTISTDCARCYWESGAERPRGLHLADEVLDVTSRAHGAGAPSTLAARELWADVYLKRFGGRAEVETVRANHLEEVIAAYGPNHPETHRAKLMLGTTIRDSRRLDEAEHMLRSAHEGLMRTLGAGHPDALRSSRALAIALMEMGRAEEAIELTRNAIQIARQALGEVHYTTLELTFYFAAQLSRRNCLPDGAGLLEGLLAMQREATGALHGQTILRACIKSL